MKLSEVELSKAYRLLNHGVTTMVSSKFNGVENVMSAAWVGAMDFNKVSAVIGTQSYTRTLIEKSGYFAVQVPVVAQAQLVLKMGEISRYNDENKLKNVEIFYQNGFDIPLVKGCVAYLICKVIPEIHNQKTYDIFFGEVISAWADERVFENGRYKLDSVPKELRTLHYVAGGQFYTISDSLNFKSDMPE
ncbi:flavin reductase family protein [Campylobacter mucosalis]|uniref:flavin reductase family protein n=1 Tax=Campylobacter mucosalis TaxID=202 RepID=UPI00147044D3|nr:flavin reductase family protein [Campylobacter mucosalis]